MLFYAAFNSISVISRRQLTLFMLSWVSPILGRGSEVSCPRTLPWKTQRIQCGLNPGPLYYESNTLPLSHAGNRPPPPKKKKKRKRFYRSTITIWLTGYDASQKYSKPPLAEEWSIWIVPIYTCEKTDFNEMKSPPPPKNAFCIETNQRYWFWHIHVYKAVRQNRKFY